MYLILCVVTSSYLLQVLNSFLSAGLAQTDACSVFAGKFGGIFASVPQPMVAAIFCILFAYFGMHQELIVYAICTRSLLAPKFSFWSLFYDKSWWKALCCNHGRVNWNFMSAVFEHEFTAEHFCSWVFIVHGTFSSTIFQRVHNFSRTWPCSYKSSLGMLLSTFLIHQCMILVLDYSWSMYLDVFTAFWPDVFEYYKQHLGRQGKRFNW